MNTDPSKLKTKDAKMTALAHIDSGLGYDAEMIAALAITDKLSSLQNESLKWYSDADEENRPLLTALEFKLDLIEAQLLAISDQVESLGINSTKFLKNRKDRFKLQRDLREKVEDLSEKLGDSWSPKENSPFLEGFMN